MKILIAVLSYNEQSNIENTLLDLVENNCGFDIVVIDDGSNDQTRDICLKMGIAVVGHCINSGNYSNAAMSYFLYAYRNQYDIVCQFDGDGQHVAKELPKIINPILRNECDVVIGSRFLQPEGFKSTFSRRLGIRLFSFIDSLIIGQKIVDVTSGFRSYSRKIIHYYGHSYKQELYDNTSQFLITTHLIGGVIKEVPVLMRPRLFGDSLYKVLDKIAFPLKGLVIVLSCLLERRNLTLRAKHYES